MALCRNVLIARKIRLKQVNASLNQGLTLVPFVLILILITAPSFVKKKTLGRKKVLASTKVRAAARIQKIVAHVNNNH